MNQQIFNPANFGFRFTDDGWYEFDSAAAHKAAKAARDEFAKEQKAAGRAIRKFTLPHQLISRGGIGSGKPHIELVVTCYGCNSF